MYRVTYGDAWAVVEPGDGRIRIPWIQADGDTRMKQLCDALVDATGTRTFRFVSPTTPDDPLREAFGIEDVPALADVLCGYDEVEEPWPDDAPEDDAVTVCFDVEWNPDV